jgi:hypothetical protein
MTQLGNVGEAMIAQMTPEQRWDSMPRPLKYVRPRLYPDGAKYLRNLLEDEQSAEEMHLTDLRRLGKSEDDSEVIETRASLGHLAQIIRDVSLGLIELVGPQRTEET